MKRLVVIDGKSVFYRGYYAMPALAMSDGTPTGGVYGFAAIAMEIVKRLEPNKVAVAWDAKDSVLRRRALYPEYKTGRVKPGEDFYAQIPLLRELCEALGWAFIEVPEFEADDIIGALCRQADEAGDFEGYIVSSDLDMLQIVDENTKMYRLLKGFSGIEEIDVPAVEQKYGILKSQFLDLKALKGDASDKIPGVPGVGEKTAVQLLNKYGTLEGVYEHISEITGALQKKLEAGKEMAFLSKELATIRFDAPVKLEEVPELVVDRERIVRELTKLEFRSLIRKYGLKEEGTSLSLRDSLGKMSYAGTPTEPPLRGEPVGSVRNIHFPIANRKTETREKSLPLEPVGNIRFPIANLKSETREKSPSSTSTSFEMPGVVAWDVKGEMHEKREVAERILNGEEFWDLNQGAFLLNPLVKAEEGEVEAEYQRQMTEFSRQPKLLRIMKQLDLPMIPVLFKMERRGMRIEQKYYTELKEEFTGEIREIEQKIYTEVGREFNLNSPVQLAEVLYGKLGLPTKGIKKGKTGYSTGAKELSKLEGLHPVIAEIKRYRELSKLLTTYVLPLPELADGEGRIHTTFTQNVTSTGRLSSVNPNLQNIPVRTEEGKKIRAGFVAEEGKVLVSADYSQFELRLAAEMAGDEALISDFNAGVDIHTKTAAEVFAIPMSEVTKVQRRAAKTINFGIIYGMSAKGLSEATGMKVGEAAEFIKKYFELRRPIQEYLERILRQAREVGYVETMWGRRRPTPDVRSSNFVVRTGAERAAKNMPIQGTEADLMKKAMILIDKKLPEGAEMICQIHDSVIVECDEGKVEEVSRILTEVMEGVAPDFKVKLKVEVSVGKNWGEV